MLATDPESGETGAREVIATLPHTDQLLTLKTSSGEIVTTEDHRYWNDTDQAWQESEHLDPDDRLLTADGDIVTVEGLDWSTVHTAAAYDLDIAGIDTYYIGAGDDEVLVHNCNILLNSSKQLQKKFNHAADFGVTGNYSKANAAKFSAALNQHINASTVTKISGTYKGNPVTHYLEKSTGLTVIVDPNGVFVSGWRLSDDQLMNVLKHGGLT